VLCVQEYAAAVSQFNVPIAKAQSGVRCALWGILCCCLAPCFIIGGIVYVSKRAKREVQDTCNKLNDELAASGRALRYRFTDQYIYVRAKCWVAWSRVALRHLRCDRFCLVPVATACYHSPRSRDQ